MSLQEKLATETKEAMKSVNKPRLSALRMMKAAVKNAEIDKRSPLDDNEVVQILHREAKRRRESIAEFRKANRQDMLAQEEVDLAVILEYLPQQMSREEILTITQKVIKETGAPSPRDKGKVMSKLMPQLKGKAEGQLVNEVVNELLVEG